MKNQALFSLKDKSIKLKCRLPHFLFGTLNINKENNFCDFLFASSECEPFLKWGLPNSRR